MKKTKFIQGLTLCVFALATTNLAAQGNWEDNSGNTSTIKTTTPDPVGIGTATPDGRTEITYCPTPTPTNGLVVTQDDCTNGAVGINPYWGSGDVATFDPNPGSGGGSEVIVKASGIPWVFRNSVLPTISIQNLLTTHSSKPTPSMPLIWARTKNFDIMSGQKKYSTKLMVMPNGFTGINTATPRTNLDVVATSGWGTPVAIFATQAQSNSYNAGNGALASFTRHLSVVPNCRQYSFNSISQAGDVGLFFTDGFGTDAAALDNGSNQGAGLVIAPWSTDNSKGGLRISSNGNVEVRGEIRTTRVQLDVKWWPDYVFSTSHTLMPLNQLALFINKNKHLPGMPSEQDVVEKGQDVGNLQQLQQEKIEELTLYTIEQDQYIKEQNRKIAEQEERLKKLEALLIKD